MALTTARTMPGVMELLPLDQIALQRMLDTIRDNFERFGFLPIETPVMEFSDVLLTKTGGETERQVYFVQSTGALEQGIPPELALRFDLTVPLARYVAEHERDLHFPFRRYQIQRVYRGERAQRGRFREFYQADIDVIGKDALSATYDAEIPAVIYNVFRDLRIGPFTIWLNNRKIMRGFFEGIGITDPEKQTLVLREVDKLDKRGPKYVGDMLTGEGLGLSAELATSIMKVVQLRADHDGQETVFTELRKHAQITGTPLAELTLLTQGIDELRHVIGRLKGFGVPNDYYAINLSIARGLDYYTGTVYETTLNEHPQIGSICSGGRYDNLATNYTKSHLPGVGISIGVTRLFWQLREAGLIGAAQSTVKVLIANLDPMHTKAYQDIATALRNSGINTEMVMETSKLAKQFKYADRAGIRFVLMLGLNEIAKGAVTVKDLLKEDQYEVVHDDLIKNLREKLKQQ